MCLVEGLFTDFYSPCVHFRRTERVLGSPHVSGGLVAFRKFILSYVRSAWHFSNQGNAPSFDEMIQLGWIITEK